MVLYFVGAWLRTVRWTLLVQTTDESSPISNRRMFQALIVGLTVNNLVPGRMGEVARLYLARRWCGLPLARTLASLVTERLLDGLVLAGLLLTSLAFVDNGPTYLRAVGLAVGAGFCAAILLLTMIAWRSDAFSWALDRLVRPYAPKLAQRLQQPVATFAAGLTLTRSWSFAARVLGLSVLVWVAELSLYYVLMLAFPELAQLASLPLAFLAGTAANFATLVPSSPGYVGTFDSILVKVLSDLTGRAPEYSTAYALVVHATLFVPVTVLGLFFCWHANLSWTQLTKRAPADVSMDVAPAFD